MINKEAAEKYFSAHSCLIGDNDVIPEDIATTLTSVEAVKFAKKNNLGVYNGYGIGDYTMMYLTKKGFFIAITYQNVCENKASKQIMERSCLPDGNV